MKRSPTAKTFKDEAITFVDEEDRSKFCSIMAALLRSRDFTKQAKDKQSKFKTFSIRREIPELEQLGIDKSVKFKFKRVEDSDELDLDIFLKKKNGISVSEYFDVQFQNIPTKCK